MFIGVEVAKSKNQKGNTPMSSIPRVRSSRENGAKSRGPVTERGKAISCLNSIRNKYLVRDLCLSIEDPDSFADHMSAFYERLQPTNNMELELVQEMGAIAWRMSRARAVETRMIENGIGDFVRSNKSGGASTHQIATEAFLRNLDTPSFNNLSRYESRLSRNFNRVFKNLIELRREPVLEPFDDNAPQIEPNPAVPEPPPPPQPPVVDPDTPSDTPQASKSEEQKIASEPTLRIPDNSAEKSVETVENGPQPPSPDTSRPEKP